MRGEEQAPGCEAEVENSAVTSEVGDKVREPEGRV